MIRDAFSDGIAEDGLYSQQDIRLLVCYLLSSIPEAMPRDVLTELLSAEGIANFFEVNQAVEDLEKRGLLTETEEGILSIGKDSSLAAQELSSRLPYPLRERSVQAALKALMRIRLQRENRVTVEKSEKGCTVNCYVQDGETTMLHVGLLVADDWQAQEIRKRFLDDPVTVYREVVRLLSGNQSI